MMRLAYLPTFHIDSSRPISFTYQGNGYQGVAGDSVATALYANGHRIFSRSFKYHRARGLYSLDGESGNCLMEINGTPNVRAELTGLREGMVVKPQNIVGSLNWDLLGFMDKLDWAMPAGFYYRWFHKPYRWWPFFLNRIRETAGLGKANLAWEGGHYDEVYLNADVCVVGGGPAGMSAASSAAEQGLRVVLMEARPWLGGFYDYRSGEAPEGDPLYQRGAKLAESLEKLPNVRIFRRTFVNGFYSDNHLTAFQTGSEDDSFAERYVEMRAASVVVATGCIERPLIFNNNERPGVMQIGCAHRLARSYGLLPGEHAVFSVGHDLGLEAAADFSDLGLEVLCVADSRQDGHDSRLVEALEQRNIPFLRGWVAANAHGGKILRGVTIASAEGARQKRFQCDVLVASAGLAPAAELLALAQAKMAYDVETGFFLPVEIPPKVHHAGRLLGLHDPRSLEASGKLAGLSAAADCGVAVKKLMRSTEQDLRKLPGPHRGSKLVMAPGKGRKRFLCFDEDVTVKIVDQTCEMGFDIPELTKRFSAAGTGPSQGGIPGHNLPLVLSQYRGENAGSVVPTTVRPPLLPTLMATYAGSSHDIFKRTPLHASQEKAGAIFRRIGVWQRARYFSRDFASQKEIENVRKNVGMIDVSTLGKFRLFGPDALKALQRVYVSDMAKISLDKAKYSAMCNEDGCVIDDGVVVRVAENDYYFTASTGRAGATIEWFRYHARYDGWDFHMVNLTDAFGAINVAGSRSREVLRKLTDTDLSNAALPYMGVREVLLRGSVPARVLRLGFVGELSYEVHVPASWTQTVWDWLMEAGAEFHIAPFGLEAQNVLRLEKGHVIIGVESEIRTTLHDLGLGFLWHREKEAAKTVGAPALRFTEHQQDRLKLIGFKMDNPSENPRDGSIVVEDTVCGHVCTARYSFTLGESIGTALVEDRLAKPGGSLHIFQGDGSDQRLSATVVKPPFYDPEGKRLRM